MTSVSTFLLEDCFWNYVDAGIPPEDTPLLTGVFEEQPLAEVVCLRFEISPEKAGLEIEAARQEVILP